MREILFKAKHTNWRELPKESHGELQRMEKFL